MKQLEREREEGEVEAWFQCAVCGRLHESSESASSCCEHVVIVRVSRKRSTASRYPELADQDWLAEHADLGLEGISKILGCSRSTACHALVKAGYRILRSWTSIEDQVLSDLYPLWGGQLCGRAIGRSPCSVWSRASRLKIKGNFSRRGRSPTWGNFSVYEETQKAFWKAWRDYISKHIVEWSQHDNNIMENFLYRPRRMTMAGDCQKCPYKEECRTEEPFCMDVSLQSAMESGLL